jgi:hypothetical protein
VIPTDLLTEIERARDLARWLMRDEPAQYYYYVGRFFSLTRYLDDEARKRLPGETDLADVLARAHGKAWRVSERRCADRDLLLVQIVDDLDVAHARIRNIIRQWSLQHANEHNRQRSAGPRRALAHHISGSANALSCLAVRLLPRDYRDRYADEFWSELFESQDLPRLRQMIIAFRLLLRAPLMRHELRAPSADFSESDHHDELADWRPDRVRPRR